MHLGYHGPTQITRQRLPETATFHDLEHHRYFIDQTFTLENGYYRPAPGQPTFDGFIYDVASKTATMLKMTVATSHDVKTNGVEWLRNQGAKEFRLVAVIPPDTSLDLPIPNTLAPLIKEVYALVLRAVV